MRKKFKDRRNTEQKHEGLPRHGRGFRAHAQETRSSQSIIEFLVHGIMRYGSVCQNWPNQVWIPKASPFDESSCDVEDQGSQLFYMSQRKLCHTAGPFGTHEFCRIGEAKHPGPPEHQFPRHLRLVQVPGDGSCLFHALAFIHGSTAWTLRKELSSKHLWSKIKDFVPHSYWKYRSDTLDRTQWGDSIHILAASIHFQCSYRIWQSETFYNEVGQGLQKAPCVLEPWRR